MAPFPLELFRDYAEFEQYLRASETQRGARWLYERSLASTEPRIVLPGTCGLCLHPTDFNALTHGGETAPGGRVPTWRETLTCGCEHRLINRERALLHHLRAASLVHRWTRILALGDAATLCPALEVLSAHIDHVPGTLTVALARLPHAPEGYHLIVSVEQLTEQQTTPQALGRLAQLLAPGGTAVFSAPFAIAQAPPAVDPAADRPISWNILNALAANGFQAARVGCYWSEEFGYLGAFNMLIMADV